MTERANGSEVHRSDPIHTPVPAPVFAIVPDGGWEHWLRGHLDVERGETLEVMSGVVTGLRQEIADALEKHVGPLQREVDELTGAMNVMRSLGHCGLRLRGSYDSAATYLAHDLVTREGSTFAACRDKPGDCPGPDWQLLAERGACGERGGRGPRGERGGRGEHAPTIKAWLVNKTKFSAAPILSDGTIGAPLELKGLFQEFLDQTCIGA
jgi:hypothetical protein